MEHDKIIKGLFIAIVLVVAAFLVVFFLVFYGEGGKHGASGNNETFGAISYSDTIPIRPGVSASPGIGESSGNEVYGSPGVLNAENPSIFTAPVPESGIDTQSPEDNPPIITAPIPEPESEIPTVPESGIDTQSPEDNPPIITAPIP